MVQFTRGRLLAALLLGAALGGCSDGSDTLPTRASCDTVAARALQQCIAEVSAAIAACYADSDSACDTGNADVLAAHGQLEASLQDSCADGDFLGLDTTATIGRFQAACTAQADSLGWRTFGGPQGAAWTAATDNDRDCLQTAHRTATGYVSDSLAAIDACLADKTCDAGVVLAGRESAASAAVATIAAACPALEELIAVEPETYVAYADDQVDCTVATAHPDPAPFSPQCGPANAEATPARGEWTQVVLDHDKWGSLCGDGTDYAFQIRLAPEGEPLDRVIVGLQGGGVCIFAQDCKSRLASSPGLFNAQDDLPLGAGLVSDDPDNPFANWTKVYLPYCNQDVFIGGGIVESLDGLELPRYGAINMRAGMRAARDIIWARMDAEGGAGFRPDELVALYGGFSAGAYGTLYNYHWVLDDLQWPRTAAFPDAGGALDNGGVGVRTLGFVKIPEWGAKPFLPPYCFTGDCAVGPDNYRAISPRLKQVPEQQYLILSNQKDNTQQRDAFFTDEAQWINTMRAAYCDTRDLPGIQWYLTSDSVNSVHVVSIRDEFFYGDVAGERMVDWLWRAVTDPDSVTDRAEEGNFVNDIPGSLPFPCELP